MVQKNPISNGEARPMLIMECKTEVAQLLHQMKKDLLHLQTTIVIPGVIAHLPGQIHHPAIPLHQDLPRHQALQEHVQVVEEATLLRQGREVVAALPVAAVVVVVEEESKTWF